MYKSVSIKDSKQSLELNASLWRLSWITFIFLPLTFLAGMFGMNVDALKDFPSLKWYFVAAVPLVRFVALLYASSCSTISFHPHLPLASLFVGHVLLFSATLLKTSTSASTADNIPVEE